MLHPAGVDEFERQSEAALETRIQAALNDCERAREAGDMEGAARHWERFVGLVARRSPKKVKRMERERGIG